MICWGKISEFVYRISTTPLHTHTHTHTHLEKFMLILSISIENYTEIVYCPEYLVEEMSAVIHK